jgi:hypothetical protein
MKRKIFMWASAGFFVAAFWALYAFATFPSTNEAMRNIWGWISLTCPIEIAGKHYPIGLYEMLAINALTYASVGLIVESLRQQLHRVS